MIILAIDPGMKCMGWCLGDYRCAPHSEHTVPTRHVKTWEELRREAQDIMRAARAAGVDIVVIEAAWGRGNMATAMQSARLVGLLWAVARQSVGAEQIVEVAPAAWMALIGDRRKMGEDAWQEALMAQCEALGGTWGEPVLRGRGKSCHAIRCADELSARGLWAWAAGAEREAHRRAGRGECA
jgi:hypothetical protein